MADIRRALQYAKQNPDSPFANELRKRIESGQMNKELESAGLPIPTATSTSAIQPEKSILTKTKEGLKSVGKSIAEPVVNLIARPGQAVLSALGKEVPTGKFLGIDVTAPQNAKDVLADVGRGIQTVALGVGGAGAGKVAGETIKQGIKRGAIEGAKIGAITGGAFQGGEALKSEDQSIGNVVGETVKGAVAGGVGGGVIGGAIPAVGAVATKTSDIAQKTGQKLAQAYETGKNVATGLKNFAGQTVESISGIPSRVATNVAEKQAIRESIKQLPLRTAQEAVTNGVDLLDAKAILKIPAEQKQPLKKLVNIVQRYASGESKVNPIEIVGKPIINRVKQLETKANTVGKKLGDISKQLGDVSEADLVYPVMEKLKKVNGLSGLKFGDEGLDFSNTVLATAETAGDRKAIEQIFNEAVKAGTGQQKHLLRQELFESLGGKKRGGVQLTGTQEKAYEAIRSGISDVLDTKNSQYKSLNNQYRKLISPINELKKIIKITDGDGAELSAGLLARRLTSSAMSNPRVRSILKMLDSATKTKGKTTLSVETLQDFYNILNKYYDIAPKTGFQNLVKEGVGGTGIVSQVSEAVGGLVGKTNAVRQASLEKLLKDVLK